MIRLISRKLRPHTLLTLTLIAFGALPVAAQTAQPARAKVDVEYQTGAVVWTQASGEIRALQYQAYYLARLSLDRDLRRRTRDRRRRAVVVDVDETVLDNSRYQASLILKGEAYSNDTWTEWCKREEAVPIPGAVEFLRYAARRGVRVFYVTNRREVEREATAANLKKLGFPNLTAETLLVRTDQSSKEARRQAVAQRHRIVLLVGDNLNDFAEVFEGKSAAERIAAVEASPTKFGTQFIMLPNAMYGDWESSIYEYNFRLSEAEKAARRRAALKGIE
jgi:5'-nucleotidase (lipoprotein e(P4) family)